ncbi:head maturation protease, ClpP-related [Mitsuokella multacida]|uniref:head maturation protease, ClpP-related n=1 Tax=Mitsuokella multacida TaxID=52226 RepID=UPI00241CBFE4|nr:head maturation protease, ClpP-related [Mitsuokella multacida]
MIKVKNNADNSAELFIYGDIIDDADSNWIFEDDNGYVWPQNIKQQLDKIDDNQPLTVYINSNGGSVPAGVAISNMIARHKGPTKAVVDGWACSIATQIFFSADKREIPENAYLMIHKPSCMCAGDADDFAAAIDMLDTLQTGLESTYLKAAKDGVTADQIHNLVEASTWLTGAEAAELFDVSVTAATTAAAYAGKSFKPLDKMPDGLKVEKAPAEKEPDPEPADKVDAAALKLKIALATI